MGCVASKKLSAETVQKLKDLFDKMDDDKGGTVTVEEARTFWAKNFAKVNACAMFNEVDGDENAEISLEEWLNFWHNVRKSGYGDKHILEEVTNMIEGGSWVDWKDGRDTAKKAEAGDAGNRAKMHKAI